MQKASRAITLLFVAVIIAGIVFIMMPDRPTEKSASASSSLINMSPLTLTSSSFKSGEMIPSKYTCDADNINPPLSISGIPEGTVSIALIMDDPDIPKEVKDARNIEEFDHWAVYNISPELTDIKEGVEPEGKSVLNGMGETGYIGPCPPPEYEPTEHRYFFKLFALDSMLDFDTEPTKSELLEALEGHILSQTELVGVYDRSNSAIE